MPIVPEYLAHEGISIDNCVLSGGEPAAVDAVARLLPGVLGNGRSAAVVSFTTDKAVSATKPLGSMVRGQSNGKASPIRLGGGSWGWLSEDR